MINPKNKLAKFCIALNGIFKNRYNKAKKFIAKHEKKLTFYTIVFLLFTVAYQQTQIATLQWRVDYINDFSREDSFTKRIYDLEYVQDSHTSDIYKALVRDEDTKDAIFNLKVLINDLKWRIMQLEWKEQ